MRPDITSVCGTRGGDERRKELTCPGQTTKNLGKTSLFLPDNLHFPARKALLLGNNRLILAKILSILARIEAVMANTRRFLAKNTAFLGKNLTILAKNLRFLAKKRKF
jgi:hypothetical protein